MVLRRQFLTVVALVLATAPVSADSQLRTQNFLVHAPTPQLAEQFGRMAEHYRKQKAVEWLGAEMPPWPRPCPLYVKPTMSGAGGATTFDNDHGRMPYTAVSMNIEGPVERMLNSVLPHEVTHTVFAHHFGCPVPRWADEGGAVLSEDDLERSRHDQLCRQYLNRPRGKMPLRRLFSVREYNEIQDDVLVLYAEGYSVSDFLVSKADRTTYLNFVATGMRGNWDRAAQSYYGFQTVEQLEEAWLQHLRDTRDIARQPGGYRGAVATMVASNADSRTSAIPTGREIVRLTVPPAQPQLDPAGPIARGKAADVPGVVPLGSSPNTRSRTPANRPLPPPVTLGLPVFAPSSQAAPIRANGPSPVGAQN